ncbi:L,D-transpeptidase [Bacillus cereus group sp. TH152-1LC]|uniref:L,D-transpeptidase n=1 Tax=Bacillus cereus group sp. TH152-1LC TaxID=3018060 RepID=UPI0022E35453|nr:L,D-transpeptidase [Bacillus cereus group sp. TH152-1LC]MDA1676805.1 L,D-transpeptidase [Bacillus cereus group sp. TH152-1LC]
MNFRGKLALTLIIVFSCVCHVQASTIKGNYILIKRFKQKLYYVKGKLLLKSFPIAIGRDDSPTSEGRFTVVYKEKNRPFYKGDIAGGAANNPLGTRWLGLNINGTEGNTYGIHGTNQIESIGMKVSGGCIRMKNTDVEWLYAHVVKGTPVIIQ